MTGCKLAKTRLRYCGAGHDEFEDSADWKTDCDSKGIVLCCSTTPDIRMSKFVNFNKRGINLPPGCKDLIDVLQKNRRTNQQGGKEVTTDELPTQWVAKFEGTLVDGQLFVRRFFDSDPAPAVVIILGPELRFTVDLLRYGKLAATARITVAGESERETHVRRILKDRGLEVQPPSPRPAVFEPLPYEVSIHIQPLPTEPGAACDLILSVLRDAFELNEGSQLQFNYYVASQTSDF